MWVFGVLGAAVLVSCAFVLVGAAVRLGDEYRRLDAALEQWRRMRPALVRVRADVDDLRAQWQDLRHR
jgi:hypothetical protein